MNAGGASRPRRRPRAGRGTPPQGFPLTRTRHPPNGVRLLIWNTHRRGCLRSAAEPLAQGGGLVIDKITARFRLAVASALLVSSTLPAPALAQTVSFLDARRDFAVGTDPQS